MASKTVAPRASRTTKASTDRASARLPIALECSRRALRDLMTEQCRRPGGFATYYSGTAAQFAAAGLPERVLTVARRTKLRVAPGGDAYDREVDAWLTPGAPRMELEIHWSDRGPGGCCHPALGESARLTLMTAGSWFEPEDWKSREAPIGRLLQAAADGVGDYRLSPDRRFQYTPEFKRTLMNMKNWLYEEIRRGEILPLDVQPVALQTAADEVPGLDIERMVSATIRRAKGAGHD